jgi:hypothetical protein
MYEPYGEKKKIKFDLSNIKEKVKEKFKDLNFGQMNKMAYVIAALVLLLAVGGITGFVTYTSKVEEMEQKYLVMERQIQTLQEEITLLNQNLDTCQYDLETTQANLDMKNQELAQTYLDLHNTENNLDVCEQDKSGMSLTISELEDDVDFLNEDLDDLQDDYSRLENNFEDLACNVAKLSSCDYYIIEGGDRVVCCFDYQGEYICAGEQVDDVREVDC